MLGPCCAPASYPGITTATDTPPAGTLAQAKNTQCTHLCRPRHVLIRGRTLLSRIDLPRDPWQNNRWPRVSWKYALPGHNVQYLNCIFVALMTSPHPTQSVEVIVFVPVS